VSALAAAPAQGQQPGKGGGGDGGGAQIPFVVGSNLYREAPFVTVVQLLDAAQHETVVNITPGGFLRGIVLQVTSATGVIGAGVIAQDAPWVLFASVSIEDISGGPILYPMTGFAAMVVQKYLRPWDGDPAKRPGFSATVNPNFTLRLMIETRETIAVVANTDARAQYRLRFTICAVTGATNCYFTTAPTTPPTVTVKGYIEVWSQPDLQDLLGNPIQPVPDGLVVSRFVMHELPQINAGNNVIRHTLMGNELRGVAWVVRNSLGTRIDLTDANAGAIDMRLDNRRLWKMNQSQLVEEMNWFYEQVANGTQTRDTGVYVYPRFRDPGRIIGEYWLQTVEQSLLQIEFTGTDLAANVPGSLEIVYDELAVAGALPANLEGL
jgi:hypothetical protein